MNNKSVSETHECKVRFKQMWTYREFTGDCIETHMNRMLEILCQIEKYELDCWISIQLSWTLTVGYDIFGLESLPGFGIDPFALLLEVFFFRSASSGSVPSMNIELKIWNIFIWQINVENRLYTFWQRF